MTKKSATQESILRFKYEPQALDVELTKSYQEINSQELQHQLRPQFDTLYDQFQKSLVYFPTADEEEKNYFIQTSGNPERRKKKTSIFLESEGDQSTELFEHCKEHKRAQIQQTDKIIKQTIESLKRFRETLNEAYKIPTNEKDQEVFLKTCLNMEKCNRK